ncbi:hypothetical protein OIU78_021286 [Salix suchowensis]|nr:hypothetical protein OIU78_021286 [Salix suchowensis]
MTSIFQILIKILVSLFQLGKVQSAWFKVNGEHSKRPSTATAAKAQGFLGVELKALHYITEKQIFFQEKRGAHLLIYDDSVDAQGCIKALGLPLVDTVEESTEDGNDKKRIEKVSGEDENKGKEAFIVQKFRALLGLWSSRRRSSSVEFVSPAPSPSAAIEAEPPAFAPKLPFHVHSYSPLHHNHQASAPQKIWREHKDKSRLQTILLAVLGSTGAAFLVCVLGLFWLSGKFKEHRKKAARIMSMQREKERSRGKSKFVSSRKSPGKVSLNPALDLLYLNSLEKDLEQRTTYLNRIPETVNTLSNHSTPKTTVHERQESKQELVMKSDSAIASSSSTMEIMPVHDDVESMMNLCTLLLILDHLMLGFRMLRLVISMIFLKSPPQMH